MVRDYYGNYLLFTVIIRQSAWLCAVPRRRYYYYRIRIRIRIYKFCIPPYPRIERPGRQPPVQAIGRATPYPGGPGTAAQLQLGAARCW
eukprot:SAG31_NODE_3604_length_4078_cov_1.491832_5_plen_89_part_00